VHWHGLVLPTSWTAQRISRSRRSRRAASIDTEFTALQSGTYLYHSHDHANRQQALGLYGALIIDPAEADPSLTPTMNTRCYCRNGCCARADVSAMPMDGAQPDYFTINGRAYPRRTIGCGSVKP